MQNLPVTKRAKKSKYGQVHDDVQDEIQGIMLKTCIPKKQTTHVIVIDYESMSTEQCKKARQGCSYVKMCSSIDPRFHERARHDFYKIVLLQKKPKIVKMRFVCWTTTTKN